MKKQLFCRIRKDILADGETVPIGKQWYGGKAKLPYRWLNADQPNETFQVKYKSKWQDAESICFEFE